MKKSLLDIESDLNQMLDKIDDYIDRYIPQKADQSETCQHLLLKNRLGELGAAVNGLRQEDLEPDPNWETVNRNAGFLGLKKRR